mgnify:CR=1 FL=1
MVYSETSFPVRYYETDQMGIVHHSNYICYYEAARSEFLRALGMSFAEVERRGIMMPILEVQSKYRKPAYFDELLTEIEGIVNSGTKLDISYYLKDFMDEDKVEDIYLYFKEDAESDSLDAAIGELGSDYTEEEIRLVRIKFICEQGN